MFYPTGSGELPPSSAVPELPGFPADGTGSGKLRVSEHAVVTLPVLVSVIGFESPCNASKFFLCVYVFLLKETGQINNFKFPTFLRKSFYL
jgi:hypothetical protein